ncbi:MAG: bifunctional adenosylcobinamide kinase/adenosylcobinamide-phosphate guanylyltransferase [Candidatus Brocadiia bacterium]
MARVILVSGGGRSGKSSHALQLADRYERRAFIATAEPLDEEMRRRIARHRRERDGAFLTVEEPLDLAGAIRSLPADVGVAVVDCLTMWLANLMCRGAADLIDFPELEALLGAVTDAPCDLILVTNEVGMGIVPADKQTRQYRDVLGRLNQEVAAAADEVVLMVCGIPMRLKEKADGDPAEDDRGGRSG